MVMKIMSNKLFIITLFNILFEKEKQKKFEQVFNYLARNSISVVKLYALLLMSKLTFIIWIFATDYIKLPKHFRI